MIRVLESEAFGAGAIHTRYLDQEGAALAEAGAGPPPEFVRAVLAAADREAGAATSTVDSRAWDPWNRVGGWSVS